MNHLRYKFVLFFGCAVLNVALLCASLYGLFCLCPEQVLFYTPYVILISIVIFGYVWYFKQKDLFEAFVICVCFCCMNFSFVFLAPYAVDRSLSTFIFFSAVQNDGFKEDAVSSQYMVDFYKRRLRDGVNGNFLAKKDDIYYPTIRAKMYYALMYPVGIVTNSMENYRKFEEEIRKE